MHVVVAIDERLAETPLARVPLLLDLSGATVLLVHVVDVEGRGEWERSAGRRLLHAGPRRASDESMRTADRAAGERLLAAAYAQAAGWGAARVETRLLEGQPKQEIRGLLNDGGDEALVLFVHGSATGPKTIGKEARFLIDHAPCPVLVVKG